MKTKTYFSVIFVIVMMTIFTNGKAQKLTAFASKMSVGDTTITLSPEEELGTQFYTGQKIMLERIMSAGEKIVKHGSVVVRNGKTINQIIFDPNTRCVIVKIFDADARWVACEKDDNLYLPYFKLKDAAGNENYFKLHATNDSLVYGDHKFKVVSGNDSQIFLNLKKIKEVKNNVRHVKGRKVR